MRIRIEDIPPRGRTLRLGGCETDLVTVGRALEVELQVERVGRGAVFTVTGAAQGQRPCDRCGAPVPLAVPVDQRLRYAPASNESATGEIELSEADLDEGFFLGDGIDTEDVLSEAFALAAPLRVTCAGGACAESLPLGERPDDVVGHPAFQALKKLL